MVHGLNEGHIAPYTGIEFQLTKYQIYIIVKSQDKRLQLILMTLGIDSLMLVTILDDSWNVFNMQHIKEKRIKPYCQHYGLCSRCTI